MRYPASEKLEIIRIVEQSHLPAKQTLDQLGIARRTFYRWYDRYLDGGPEALADRPSAPSRVWNRIPPDIHDQIIELALEQSHLPQRRCLASLGIPRQTFYRWYDRFRTGGPEALADRPSRPNRVWNRIPVALSSME